MSIPRWLNPKTNPALYSALLGLAYAIWQGELAASAHGPLTWTRVSHIAAGVAWAWASAWIRGKVTPVADPRDGNGNRLSPLPPLIPLTEAQIDQMAAKFAAKAMTSRPPAQPPAGGKP